MNTQRFAPSDNLELRQADLDVAIKGWDEEAIELVLDGDPEQCVTEQQGTTLVLTAHIPLAIHAPRDVTVSIGQVSGDLLLRDLDRLVQVETAHGDVSIQSGQASVSLDDVHGDLAVERLDGPLSVGQAHGDVHLSQVGAVTLGRVHGDVHARAVAGELRMSTVSGDIQVRDLGGLLTLEEGQGDMSGHDLAGGMKVQQVKGSLSLKTALTPGLTYSGQASGDIVARFPEGTSARFNLEAKGQISVKGLEVEEQDDGRVIASAGEGEAEVVLRADGDLSARVRGADQDQPWGFSMDDLSEQINAEIARHMDKFGERLPDFGALVSREVEKGVMREVEREIRKAQRQAEKAAHRAQEHVRAAEEHARRAQERVQEHARAAEERARRAQERVQEKAKQFQAKFERKWGPPPDAGFGARAHAPRGRATAQPRASREEQLAVLKMLQEGKISTEEAETLLKALGI